MPNKLISGVIIEKSESLTLEEFSYATKTTRELIVEMVDLQLIQPEGKKPEEWKFNSISLKRGRIASSFYHDLGVNMPGVALALELLDKIEYLRQEISIYQKVGKK